MRIPDRKHILGALWAQKTRLVAANHLVSVEKFGTRNTRRSLYAVAISATIDWSLLQIIISNISGRAAVEQ